MIVIHPLKVCYQDAPKLGSTSIFDWFYRLLTGKEFVGGGGVHSVFWNQKINGIESVPIEKFNPPDDYYIFTISRDPVERLISAWRNRVMHYKELGISKVPEISKSLLRANPSINYFVSHLEEYRRISRSVAHHTEPMISWIGVNISVYDKVYDLSELSVVEQDLRSFWRCNGMVVYDYAMRTLQTGGPRVGIEIFDQKAIEKTISFYRNDYELLKNNMMQNGLWQNGVRRINQTR